MKIHDYYDGLAHCVECGGPCRLPQDTIDAGNAIRHLMEGLALSGRGPNMMISGALSKLGVDAAEAYKRARAAVSAVPRPPDPPRRRKPRASLLNVS